MMPINLFSMVFMVLMCSCHTFVLNAETGKTSVDPLLVQICKPLMKPSHGRVYCAYNAFNLTCEATCDLGYHFNDYSVKNVLSCNKESGWTRGKEFPKCRRICLQHLVDCIGRQDGDYPSCKGCNHYVTCARDGASDRLCPPSLEFDNSSKRCVFVSTTCV